MNNFQLGDRQVLTDNGIDPDEVAVVLQAIGYVLLDEELYSLGGTCHET